MLQAFDARHKGFGVVTLLAVIFADRPSWAEAAAPARLTATEAFSLKQHAGAVTRLAFHPSLPLLASAGKDGRVLLWDLDKKTAVELEKFNKEVWTVKFSPDGNIVTYADRNHWRSVVPFKAVVSGNEIQRLKDFKLGGSVCSLAYSPDGSFFATGQENGAIRLWETVGFREIVPLSVGRDAWSLAFGPVTYDRKRQPTKYLLAVGSGGGSVMTFDLAIAKDKNGAQWTFVPSKVAFPNQAPVLCVRFSPDGKLLACARENGSISFFGPATGQPIYKDIHASDANVEWLSFHPQRPWIVAAHWQDRLARIWNYETGEMLCECPGHTGGVFCAEFSRDGRRVATASDDFSIKIWDLASSDLPAAPKRPKKGKPTTPKVGD